MLSDPPSMTMTLFDGKVTSPARFDVADAIGAARHPVVFASLASNVSVAFELTR